MYKAKCNRCRNEIIITDSQYELINLKANTAFMCLNCANSIPQHLFKEVDADKKEFDMKGLVKSKDGKTPITLEDEAIETTPIDRPTAPKNDAEEGKEKISITGFDMYMKYVPAAYEEGVIKYKKDSWRKGFHTSKMFDAAMRHLGMFFYGGENFDKETKEKYGINKHHLAAVIFCCLSMLHSQENYPELDDRPGKI